MKKRIDELRELLETSDLQLAAIDIGGWDVPLCLANLDESLRLEAVQNVKRAIAAAGKLGCSLFPKRIGSSSRDGRPDGDWRRF